jgi:5-dehydro-2-deoxygluconokinase
MITFSENRPIDIICMGRVAVDLYADDIGYPLADATTFKKYLGGCAGNIAVGTARLGLTSMMFSCVGQDEMGRFVRDTLTAEGVDTELLYDTPNHLTGLVLLGVKPPNEFPLMFYRENCADMQLQCEHVKEALIGRAKSLLITGTGLSKPTIRETSWYTANLARKLNTAVIMDLDYRPILWGLTAKGNGETRYIASQDVSEMGEATI